ncbi:MAG: hypothetical protein SOT60_09945 [Bilifractor sp.]|nr:hypothetical protein [Bilifractor sp.]
MEQKETGAELQQKVTAKKNRTKNRSKSGTESDSKDKTEPYL